MSDLFEELRERTRGKLRSKGWREDSLNSTGARYWWTPDGREMLLEEEAILRMERED